MALNQFANTRPDVAKDPVVKIVNQLFRIAPGVLTEHGKTKNPVRLLCPRSTEISTLTDARNRTRTSTLPPVRCCTTTA